MDNYFKDKTVIVTGGAGGIGKAITDNIIEQGGRVIVVDIKSFETVEQNDHLIYCEADITNAAELTAITLNLRENYKVEGIDGLFLCAGIPAAGNEEEKVMEVNVKGTKNCFEAFSPLLSTDADVIFLSSDLITDIEERGKNIYAMSKLEMAKYASEMVKQHPSLRILILLPGPVMTDLFEAGKPRERMDAIDVNVGIDTPKRFAGDVMKVVEDNSFETGSFVRMYLRKGITLVPQSEFI